MALYTIGHSTLSEPDFEQLIEPLDIVMDIRSHPSSKWPQYHRGYLEKWLGNRYEWEPRLGGWSSQHIHLIQQFEKYQVDIAQYARGKFPKQRIGKKFPQPDDPQLDLLKPSWTNQGLWDQQFFQTLPEFIEGAKELIERGKTTNIGIMCCELLWWKCHRSMIADYIVWRGYDITHLQPKTTLHSKAIGNRLERYHPDVIQAWQRQS